MILPRLEILEGNEKMANKKHVNTCGPTPALDKRMVEPRQGQQLSLICDSAFNSLKGANTMLEMVLHAFGCEKCGRGCYPI